MKTQAEKEKFFAESQAMFDRLAAQHNGPINPLPSPTIQWLPNGPVAEYTVLEAASTDRLIYLVAKHIKEGWQPFGGASAGHTNVVQAMVKYEPLQLPRFLTEAAHDNT